LSRHTEGPWKKIATLDGPKATAYVIGRGPDVLIKPTPLEQLCDDNAVAIVAVTGPASESNARLIAAAPDYHAAAEKIRQHVEAPGGDMLVVPDDLIRDLLDAHKKAST
jgi:3',5'-cyclic AMP phosphodiesterase CpdA